MKNEIPLKIADNITLPVAHRCNIYICYHPADEGAHSILSAEIDRIGESLLFKNTTAGSNVCFVETTNLSEAGLLLLIVSNTSLSKRDEIISPVLALAEEKNIPVLPVLIEDCPADVINNTLGGRHCFSLNEEQAIDRDLSNRLEDFLSFYICDSDLASRIRKVAYRKQIFVSYRRKDRKCVQAFLKKIQADDRFVDVALWRDVCLTPGEVFTEELAQSISSSDVFLLCVTDSTFESGNYILANELPLAIRCKIPIVPVELSSSGCHKISEINGIVDKLYSEDDALERIDEVIPRTESLLDFSAEKSYLLGRAYWLGVGTEINYGRAVLLNQQAIECNYEEAKRLNDIMGIFRHGARRNIENALTWSEHKAEYLRGRVKQSARIEDILALCEVLFSLANTYLTSPNGDKDPGTTQIKDLGQDSSRTINTGKECALCCLQEIVKICEILCKESSENISIACVLVCAYEKLCWLLYSGFGYVRRVSNVKYSPAVCEPFLDQTLGYSLALEKTLEGIDNSNDSIFKDTFLSELLVWQKKVGLTFGEGMMAFDRIRGENYERMCLLLDRIDGSEIENREWSVWFCKYAWSRLLKNPRGMENIFWGNKLLYACDRITGMLEYEGQAEKAKEIYEMFLSGEISKHIDDIGEWNLELHQELKEFGFWRLVALCENTGDIQKVAELLTRKWKY